MQSIIDAFIDIVLWIPRALFGFLADAVEFMLSWIPTIDMADVQSLMNSLGGDLLYFLGIFEFNYGLTAVMSALIARFLLRRIPLIG